MSNVSFKAHQWLSDSHLQLPPPLNESQPWWIGFPQGVCDFYRMNESAAIFSFFFRGSWIVPGRQTGL